MQKELRNIVIASIFFTSTATAQTVLHIGDQGEFCSFAPTDVIESELYGFESSEEAEELVADIMSTVGLVPRFKISAGNVPNAAAVIDGENRLIFYSESWVQKTMRNNRWAAVSLMAHEIAHHLNGHTLTADGSRPPTELEADLFSGFAVGKLGGSLSDAQWLFEQLGENGSDTHPPRSARLEAVAVGWRDATGGTVTQQPQNLPTAGMGFIFSDSDTRLISGNELQALTRYELRIARNEIFARRGRYFKSADLKSHFSQFNWYQPYSFDVPLNDTERTNVSRIKGEENSR